jgi:hypothetical protein
VTTKNCTKCGKPKVVEKDFYSWFDKKYGKKRYQAWCKDCMKAHQKSGEKGRTPKVSLDAPVVTPRSRAKDVEWFELKIAERRQRAEQNEKLA